MIVLKKYNLGLSLLNLLRLSFLTIISGAVSLYLYYYKGEIPILFLYPYIFGTLISIIFFIQNILSLTIYSINLKKLNTTTPIERITANILSRILGLIFLISIIVYIVNLFGLDIGIKT